MYFFSLLNNNTFPFGTSRQSVEVSNLAFRSTRNYFAWHACRPEIDWHSSHALLCTNILFCFFLAFSPGKINFKNVADTRAKTKHSGEYKLSIPLHSLTAMSSRQNATSEVTHNCSQTRLTCSA